MRVEWGRMTSHEDDGRPRTETTTIECRWEDKPTQVLDANAAIIVASARCFTKAPVSVGDTLRGRHVISVTAIPDIAGRTREREVAVK